MTWFAIALLLWAVFIVADLALFCWTPYEARPQCWWRHWTGSGFIMYARHKLSPPQGDADK